MSGQPRSSPSCHGLTPSDEGMEEQLSDIVDNIAISSEDDEEPEEGPPAPRNPEYQRLNDELNEARIRGLQALYDERSGVPVVLENEPPPGFR